MISESTFTSVFGAVPAGSTEASLVHLCREAIRRGYAIVPCHPGTKKPMCTLSSREVNKADELARETARANGHRKWATVRHACGLYHAMTETKESDRVIKRLVRDHGHINIGIELKRSRVVVVDVDTEAEDKAFRDSWCQETGGLPTFGLTVRSPGMVDRGGQWAHKNGGHYYFKVPDNVDMPTVDGAMKDPSGWIAMWADRQVLVPPSVRQEGPYELIGDVHPMPMWLLKKILTHALERKTRAEEQAQRSAERAQGNGETASIDSWSAETSWTELLEPDGWYDTGLPDNCGCDIWTAPGVHASHKSATAHDIGCARYDDSPGHAPLHVWTDNPPEWLSGFTKTFTKIQYVANRDHQGSLWHACEALGIAHEGLASGPLISPLTAQESMAMVSMAGSRERPPDPLPQPSETSGPALGEVMGPLSPLSSPRSNGTHGTGSSMLDGLPPVPPSSVAGEPIQASAEVTLEDKLGRRVADKLFEIEADRRVAEIRYPFAATMAASSFVRAIDDYDEVMAASRQFLVAGWLPECSDIALGAEYKAGKTFISMDTAVSIASGSNFLGTFAVTRQRPVAIMAGEANPKDFYQKITAICESRKINVREVLSRLFVKFGAWKLDDPRMVERVYDQCHEILDLGLIIIDPWYLAAGSADGKTLSVMGDVLSNLTGLRAELNTSLMITTHWNQTGTGRGFNRWTGNGLQEWGRTLINVALDGPVAGPAPYSTDKTGQTTARLSIVLKGEAAGSYGAARTVWREDALDLDSPIRYTVTAQEVEYDESEEMTPAEKNQLAEERKSDQVLLKVLQYIGTLATKPPTERQVLKGKMGPDSGSATSRKAQLDIAIAEGWVEASGKMAPALKGGKIQHDPQDPEKGSDTLVLTRAGHDKRKTLESPHAPFITLSSGTPDVLEE